MAPIRPGTYQVRCEETGYQWSVVKVYRAGDGLRVDCPDVGRGYPVEHYHNGLTNPEWQLLGW